MKVLKRKDSPIKLPFGITMDKDLADSGGEGDADKDEEEQELAEEEAEKEKDFEESEPDESDTEPVGTPAKIVGLQAYDVSKGVAKCHICSLPILKGTLRVNWLTSLANTPRALKRAHLKCGHLLPVAGKAQAARITGEAVEAGLGTAGERPDLVKLFDFFKRVSASASAGSAPS